MKKLLVTMIALLSASACANEEQTLKPGDVFKDCDQCPEMVVIPAGVGMVGLHPKASRKRGLPWRKVNFPESFAVGKFEVLMEEYHQCVFAQVCTPSSLGYHIRLRKNPAHDLSWHDAKSYVKWLSQKTGKQYRLLSENEWVYAARAGTTTLYWWGDDFQSGFDVCDGCETSSVFISPIPAGSGMPPPNPFGLYFMLGNASEWIEDCLDKITKTNFPNSPQPMTSSEPCKYRKLKGGGYRTAFSFIHASEGLGVSGSTRSIRNSALSFRVARDLD